MDTELSLRPLELECVFAATEQAAEPLGVGFSAGVRGFFPMTRVTVTSSRFWQRVVAKGGGYERRQAIPMKKALMFLAISFALSAPVGGLVLTLMTGTTAVTTVRPQQAFAKLQHFRLVRHT